MAVAAMTREGAPLALDQKRVDGLRAALRGPLLLAGDAGYDESRSVWNAMIDRRPALVARCIGVSDILAGLRFARESGIALSLKGGGHNISGLAVAEGGLMLDLSLMRGVWVDPRSRIARAQAGCLLGDVDRETQLHGLPPCSASSPPPASPGSPWAAASGTPRAASGGRATTSGPWTS